MKNESDIIEQTLSDALRWCDEIFLLDNGSDDDGWQRVQSMSKLEPRIIPVGCDLTPFHDGIRARLYNANAAKAAGGDWWCRLDADEFYVDDPREILVKTPDEYFSVWSASISYYFTDIDAERYFASPDLFNDDVPITEKCRYYLNHWSEPRFFRHDPTIGWQHTDGGFPRAVWSRPAAPMRIPIRHFAYRSPTQIQKRLDTRRTSPGMPSEFSHEMVKEWAMSVTQVRNVGYFAGTPDETVPDSWKSRIVPAAALDYDAHDGVLVINEDLMPPIPQPWSPFKVWAMRIRSELKRASIVPSGRWRS
ncbi:glycosyltransferase family 2 protein [Arthrobacter pascens]|uniref:glycosyltransferase family 2 protein n=1 Tax=Arthrobacter pascens TaxID=1677 RepID=UPI0027D7C86D|nr:glycosyltransferase family 2 protein [Arthrobacter pascens]